MSEFSKVASRQELQPGAMKLFEVDERMVILFRTQDDRFCCIDDVCTHDGGSLSDGELQGGEIACPRHGARFDICSGRALSMPATRDTAAHEVRVDGDDVYVKINEDA